MSLNRAKIYCLNLKCCFILSTCEVCSVVGRLGTPHTDTKGNPVSGCKSWLRMRIHWIVWSPHGLRDYIKNKEINCGAANRHLNCLYNTCPCWFSHDALLCPLRSLNKWQNESTIQLSGSLLSLAPIGLSLFPAKCWLVSPGCHMRSWLSLMCVY